LLNYVYGPFNMIRREFSKTNEAGGQTPHTSRPPRLWLDGDVERPVRRLVWTISVSAVFLLAGLAGLRRTNSDTVAAPNTEKPIPVVLIVTEPASAPNLEAPPGAAPVAATPALPVPNVAVTVTAYSPELVSAARVSAQPSANLIPARETGLPSAPTTAPPTETMTPFKPGSGAAFTPQPEYPPLALRRGYQGRVVVNFTVGESGAILEATLGRSSGYAILDEAALNAVLQHWRFPPGTVRRHFVEIAFLLK
jgi:periplasmic protein TonB